MQPAATVLQQSLTAGVLEHSRLLSRLNHWLESHLPEPLNRHSQAVNVRDQTLILGASSPVWASRLRYLAPQLMPRLNRDISLNLLNMKVKVRPSVEQPVTTCRPRAALSAQTAQLLLQVARDIDHPGLQTAMTRIAACGRKI